MPALQKKRRRSPREAVAAMFKRRAVETAASFSDGKIQVALRHLTPEERLDIVELLEVVWGQGFQAALEERKKGGWS